MRLLIVDDDEVFADTLARACRRRGCEVVTAGSGQAALAALLDPDITGCILDLRIADESGLQLIPELLQRRSGLRILMLTGYSAIATAVEAIKRGAADYLAKPAPVDDILRALQGASAPVNLLPGDVSSPSVDRLAWEHIQRVLLEEGGNVSSTARRLGMHRRTLQRRLIKRPVAQ